MGRLSSLDFIQTTQIITAGWTIATGSEATLLATKNSEQVMYGTAATADAMAFPDHG
jgi:hypothetical protein